MEYSICKNPRLGKRGVSYARFSSHNQRSESIEIQHDANFAFMAIQDIDLVGVFSDEAKSGRNTNREDFQRMLTWAREGRMDFVVIYKVTRIMRNRDEMAMLRVELRKYGVEILYSGEDIGKGSDAVLQLGLKEVLAEWESAQLGERIVDGINKNAERCMANGNTLYGWDIVDGYYVVNDLEASVLRRAKSMLFNGKTVAEIVRALEGHTTKRGKPIKHNTLTKLLKRKQNAGMYSYAGHEQEDGMPALWTMEEQRMIWKILGDDTRPRKKAASADFLLTGKLWCGACNMPMTGTSGTGKSGRVYYYYQDRNGCGRKVRKDVIEQNVADAVLAALSEEATREKIADLMCEFEEWEDPTPMSEVITSELNDIAKQHANILKAIEQGIIPDGAKERIETLKAREEVLRDELRIAESMEAATADRDRVLFWLENIAEVADTKTLIDVFVSKVVLLGDDLHIVMHFDDNDDPTEKAAVLDRGGGVLPSGTTLHQPFKPAVRRAFLFRLVSLHGARSAAGKKPPAMRVRVEGSALASKRRQSGYDTGVQVVSA
uniref:recombinase family protein n=1 Tax=Adlercreutzia sp. TaxID=1872387 RepID=UPI003AB53EEE